MIIDIVEKDPETIINPIFLGNRGSGRIEKRKYKIDTADMIKYKLISLNMLLSPNNPIQLMGIVAQRVKSKNSGTVFVQLYVTNNNNKCKNVI